MTGAQTAAASLCFLAHRASGVRPAGHGVPGPALSDPLSAATSARSTRRLLWNDIVTGFESHHQGHTRENQRRSRWDTLHLG